MLLHFMLVKAGKMVPLCTTDCLFINWSATTAKLVPILPRDWLGSILFSSLQGSSAVLGRPSLFIPMAVCSLLMSLALWLTPWPSLLHILWPGSLQWLCTYLLLCFGETFWCLSPIQWSQFLLPPTMRSTYVPVFIHQAISTVLCLVQQRTVQHFHINYDIT